jgi:hypothetical protein
MLRFDATGRIFWSKTGYLSPQLATADGNFIASSDNPQYGRTAALVFDRYGNFVRSITEFPIQSWTGNMYRLGSADELPNAAYDLLASFAAWPGGNQSNGSAVGQSWFPPLPSCTVQPGQSPCAKEAIEDALTRLRQTLSTTCTSCDTALAGILPGWNQKAFAQYLSLPARFSDGTRSNAPVANLCASGLYSRWLDCDISLIDQLTSLLGHSPTVQQYMAGKQAKDGKAAVTQTPSDKNTGLTTFFDPRIICRSTAADNKEILNEALLFHEGLHGWLGVRDGTLVGTFRWGTSPLTYYFEENIWQDYLSYLHDVPTDPEPMQCPN